jgi:Protein involved in cell division
MKNGQMQNCIDYIRFTMEMEGAELSAADEQIFLDILDEKFTADECIENYKAEQKLDENYIPVTNEESFYPDTKCLVNYFNIKDKAKLKEVELFCANSRTAELFLNDEKHAFTFEYLLTLHHVIFGDVYPSAGAVRRVEVSRRTEFCRPENISRMSTEIFAKLSRDKYLAKVEERDDFINDLAFYMGELEALHPFRDGNGRTARYFFYALTRNAGYDIAWSEADANRSLEANIAAIDGDYQPLVDVLEELVSEKD